MLAEISGCDNISGKLNYLVPNQRLHEAMLLPLPMAAGSAVPSPNLVMSVSFGGPLVIATVEVAATVAGFEELEVPVCLIEPEQAGSAMLETAGVGGGGQLC